MYARLVLINLEPGSLAVTEKLAEEHALILRDLKGIKSVTFFSDDEAGEYGSFSIWETREDAEAITGSANLQVKDTLGSVMKGRPSVRIFNVYDVKG